MPVNYSTPKIAYSTDLYQTTINKLLIELLKVQQRLEDQSRDW